MQRKFFACLKAGFVLFLIICMTGCNGLIPRVLSVYEGIANRTDAPTSAPSSSPDTGVINPGDWIKPVQPTDSGISTLPAANTVKFSYPCNVSQTAAPDAFIDAFSKAYPHVTVVKDYDYTEAQTASRVSSGQIGDVFFLAEAEVYEYAVTKNVLLPLNTYIEQYSIDIEGVYKGLYETGVINGQCYFVAREFNQMILAYNKDRVKSKGYEAAVKPEWTWDEFLFLCQELSDASFYGARLDLSFGPVLIPLLEAYEGHNTWFDLADKKVTFTSGSILHGVEEVVQAAKSGYINIGYESDLFEGREPIFQSTVYPGVASIGTTYDVAGVNWDMINMPLTKYPAFGSGCAGFSVYGKTQNPAAAAALALFFYTNEGQTAFHSQEGGSVPVLTSLINASFWQHTEDTWADKNWNANVYKADEYAIIGRFECILPHAVAKVITGSLPGMFQSILNGDITVVNAFRDLETAANNVWSGIA